MISYIMFSKKVLQISAGIEEPGILRWEIVACLITAWVMVYFSIWKSIKSSAQVRYLTATLPFLLIFGFLLRSLTLPGADKGLQYFFRPQWELLGNAKVNIFIYNKHNLKMAVIKTHKMVAVAKL